MTLTNARIERIKPHPSKVQFYGDLHGLRLRVLPSKTKTAKDKTANWTQRIQSNGRRRDFGLGSYPEITLAEARDKALANRRVARKGGNPAAAFLTFKQVHKATLELDAPSWKSPKQRHDTAAMMDRYSSGLYDLPASQVATSHVMRSVEPIWHSHPTQAKRLLQRFGRIFDYCIAHDIRRDNPADSSIIRAALPKQASGKVAQNHEALPHAEVGAALAKVDASGAMEVTKALVRFVALTVVRISEAKGARWSEIDFEARLWVIPSARMKRSKSHSVPLSDQALAVLNQLSKRSDLIFANPKGKEIGDATVRKLFQALDIATVHGLRSSFRNWCGENTTAMPDVIELCLAHAVGSSTERSYNRSDLLEMRRTTMQAWADYLTP